MKIYVFIFFMAANHFAHAAELVEFNKQWVCKVTHDYSVISMNAVSQDTFNTKDRTYKKITDAKMASKLVKDLRYEAELIESGELLINNNVIQFTPKSVSIKWNHFEGPLSKSSVEEFVKKVDPYKHPYKFIDGKLMLYFDDGQVYQECVYNK